MSESKGTLNTLLNYRFVKRTSMKSSSENASTSQSNGNGKGSEANSDSQSTVPYNSQNSFNSDSDSQKTIPYSSQNGSSVAEHSSVPNSTAAAVSPVFKGTGAPSSSPVFKSQSSSNNLSSVQNGTSSGQAIPRQKQTENVSPGTPWISKATGGPVHKVQDNSNYKRIKRPDPDSDSDDDAFGKDSGIKIDKEKLKKLRDHFPHVDINRLKAAIFAHGGDFEKSVKFVENTSHISVSVKRQHEETEDQSDDLPPITGSRKRIKMMPETPSPTGPSSSSTQDSIKFLKECFPGKSEEHIQRVLNENNGQTDMASLSLANEDSQDAKVAKSLASSTENPESGSSLKKIVKAQKSKASNGTVKQRANDMSDDEEDEYGEGDSGDSDDSDVEFENKTRSETDNILQFFREATVEELSAMPGCSKKKAELIISLRPFETWEDLCNKFNTRTLSLSLISGSKEIMRVRNTIHRLMIRCENISQDMEKVVASLSAQSQNENLADVAGIVKQPDLLNKDFSLKPYQLIGLSWLRIMHEQELNGILADEMGLGKTIQAISFLAHLLEEGEEGPHVIIVPASTIENWLRELQLWCPALKVIVYFGSQDERRAVRHSIFVDDEEFHVLLTTYNIATGSVEDRVLFKKYNFHYAIFDEGHMLKNMSSLRFQNLMKIAADRRLLLTGTPLQNNILELMSLLCFVMPDIFQGKTDHLKKMFSMITRSADKQKSRYEQARIAQAKRIMKPFVLRRLKSEVLRQLPKKTEKIVKCRLTEPQRVLYDSLINRYAQDVEKANEEETAVAAGGINYFMMFRKAANHPLLLRNLYTDEKLSEMAKKIAKEPSHRDRGALPKLIQEDMATMNDFDLLLLCRQYKKYIGSYELDSSILAASGKFEKLDEILPPMKEKGDRILLFSQFTMMLDIMEHYLEQRQHKFIRLDGQTAVTDRLQLIDRYNNEPDIFIFLLSTRAGGLGINLTAANTIILHDIDFNPYNDKQAEDRCHRMGQTREVKVIRLIGEDTVDESMLQCANQKLALEKDLHGPDDAEDKAKETKDVANLLKEVLRKHQQHKGHALTESQNTDVGTTKTVGRNTSDMIEIGDDSDDDSEETNAGSKGSVNRNGAVAEMIEIGDDDDDDEYDQHS